MERFKQIHGSAVTFPLANRPDVEVMKGKQAAPCAFPLLEMPLVVVAALIGAITFFLCYAAVWLGAHLGTVASRSARSIGGLFLIGIGVHILIEHLA